MIGGYLSVAGIEGKARYHGTPVDPLLAVGRHGAGRGAAFASDCAPHWCPPAFMAWPGYDPLWGNVVRWLFPANIPNGPGACPRRHQSIPEAGQVIRTDRQEKRGVAWTCLTALILMTLALPALLARLAGGYPPNPRPELAALAPLAVVPAIAAVIIAAYAAWWLAALLAIPAALLVTWQLPPLRRARFHAALGPARGTGSAAATLRLRLFTVNAKRGAADLAALLRILRQHDVDVLAVQELTPDMASRMTAAGLTQVLLFSHLDPRHGSRGTGLWARWSLTPLPPVPGLTAAAPRARIDPLGWLPVTLTAVHLVAPVKGPCRQMAARAGDDPAGIGCRR